MWSLDLLALIRIKHRVVGWASSMFASPCNVFSCRFILRLSMGSFVQHDNLCMYVSFWRDVHRLNVGDMFYLRMWSR